MEKLFRKLWVGLLSGTAALVSCNFEPDSGVLYGPPAEDDTIVDTVQPDRQQIIQERLSTIRDILEERQNAVVPNSPEAMEKHVHEIRQLKAEADSLEKELRVLEFRGFEQQPSE